MHRLYSGIHNFSQQLYKVVDKHISDKTAH